MRNWQSTKTMHSILSGVATLLFAAGLYGQKAPVTGPPATVLDNAPIVLPGIPDPSLSQQDTKNQVQTAPVVGTDASVDNGDGNAEATDYVPKQGSLTPHVALETVNSDDVFTIHIRPLFVTLVRLPEEVTSIAIGAPTLVAAEHDKAEPKLVVIKPTTHKAVDSNVIVALRSGRTVAIRVISAGDEGSSDPVDFVVDYGQAKSLWHSSGSNDDLPSNMVHQSNGNSRTTVPEEVPRLESAPPEPSVQAHTQQHRNSNESRQRLVPSSSTLVTDSTPVAELHPLKLERHKADTSETLLDRLYDEQQDIAAPIYSTAAELTKAYPANRMASPDLAAALGRAVQVDDKVTISYSVINRSRRWVEVLPPLLQFNNPAKAKKSGKPDKKHPESLEEQIPIKNYRMSREKLAPGERLDAAVEFERPGFKYRKEQLLLQIANASEVDTALLVPVPFVVAEKR